jgi:hypothetical protein
MNAPDKQLIKALKQKARLYFDGSETAEERKPFTQEFIAAALLSDNPLNFSIMEWMNGENIIK